MDLNNAWEYLNERAFDGCMRKPAIYAYHAGIWHGKEPLAGCYHWPSGGSWDRSEILVSKRLNDMGMLETLFHEMCHQYIHEVLLRPDVAHGKVFKEVYNEGLRRLND
jgi:hypothetical protein